MKTKKLEKKTAFIFKNKSLSNLRADELHKINGGDRLVVEFSMTPACVGNKTIKTVSVG